jgi:hypothetical protein
MSIDTSVLDTSMAVTPELAWSLAGDDAVLDFPDDQPESDDDAQVLGERYGWWLVWRRAVLLVVVAAALAAVLVYVGNFAHLPRRHAAAQSPTPDSAAFLKEEAELPSTFYGPEVCGDIAAGDTVQQIVDAIQNSPLTLEQLRAEVNTAIQTYCP